MRYYFMLIPPTILSLWTVFQVYNGGVLSPRDVHKKFFLIVNHSEAFFKNKVKENVERNNGLSHSVPTQRKGELPTDSVSQHKKDEQVSDSVSTQTIDKVVNNSAPIQTTDKVVNNSSAKESKNREDFNTNTTLESEAKGITSETVVNCSKDGENLVGPLIVDRSIVSSMEDLERAFSVKYGGWVKKGGAWKPPHCRAFRKVAIILPYRNRYEQLKIFLRHLHPILKRQLLDYRVFIVEQDGSTIFNRAILFNIGFKEVQKFNNYRCFIFHDVDLLPEDDNNMYNCPTSPRHMCPAVDKFFYRLPYHDIFGGVEAIWKEHFEKVNGFSNKYWGWGGEDDDLYHRCIAKGLKLTRSSMKTGRFKMLKEHHHVDGRKDHKRTRQLLNGAVHRMKSDGLNTLKYNLLQMDSYPLYTHIKVEVDTAAV